MKDMQTSYVLVTLTRKYSSEIFSRRIHWLPTYEAYTICHTVLAENLPHDHGVRLNPFKPTQKQCYIEKTEVQKLEFDGGGGGGRINMTDYTYKRGTEKTFVGSVHSHFSNGTHAGD